MSEDRCHSGGTKYLVDGAELTEEEFRLLSAATPDDPKPTGTRRSRDKKEGADHAVEQE